MTLRPPRDGDFYIDNADDYFYLRESGAYAKKGKFVRSHALGLWSEGPFPFTAQQYFELAITETDEHYYQAFSAGRSLVSCIFPTSASCDVILTDSLSGYLGKGSNVICTAHFEGVAQNAVLTFRDYFVRAGSPLWVVMPTVADATMAGIRCLYASEPV